ncbi:relaxase/mobilization nuclease domain-containing protein [Pseudorhodobacter sp. E13]|uniref:relaxase/mobilization nuclease domain-containing protein n=1 Tax=Pseudorhodobacter sp. E13 TaxID=2487931 RepID=UPI0013154068|nr:relaxase/mobilization nuclease domain-containing protein [Pseudorhodobacter sp. E13]
MIIKSMSRKTPTFAQLASYIGREPGPASGTSFVRNLYADGRDTAPIVAQFLDNYRYLPERKGGNALYHEVIVLEPQPHLAADTVETALHALAEKYCQQRAPHQLAWGRVHHDTEFPHIHLMISANSVRSDRRVRMERSIFAHVQRDLERWRAENLPQLKARVIYGHEHEKQSPRQPCREGEMVRRTKKPSRKQQVYQQVQEAIGLASDRSDLIKLLNQNDFELYERGKTIGVIDRGTGKRYRLQTLGLSDALLAIDLVRGGRTVPNENPPLDARAQQILRRRMGVAAREQLVDPERDLPERF